MQLGVKEVLLPDDLVGLDKDRLDQVRSDVPGERCACDDGGISLTSQDKQVHLSMSQSHCAPGDGQVRSAGLSPQEIRVSFSGSKGILENKALAGVLECFMALNSDVSMLFWGIFCNF